MNSNHLPPTAPTAINSSASTFTMSPHDPSLVSLLGSMLEPNFLILVVYLSINLALAFKVIRVATRRYRQINPKPSVSGHFGVVEQPIADDETSPLELYDDFLRRTSGRSSWNTSQSTTKKTDTPVADALIRISTWALRRKAANAKRILALLSILSLGSTWYYMIAFLRQSYLEYLEQCRLTSYPLPPAPPPLSLSRLDLLVPTLHLRILRISQWLASLSLFKQAWMEVIKDNSSWWWSSEICIITVGAWALFLRHEAARLRIPHVWTVMALGQLVAISFAFNLFNLAVIYRLDARQLLDMRCEKVIKPHPRIFDPAPDDDDEDFEYEPSSEPSTDSEQEQSDSRSRYHVAMPMYGPPHNPNVRVLSTQVITQRKPLPSRPTFMDKVGHVLLRWIPESIGLPLFVLAGMSSVLQHPNSFTKVMIMHLFPLFISLYPDSSSWRQSKDEKLPAQILFGAARVQPDGTVERQTTARLNFGVTVHYNGMIERRLTPRLTFRQMLFSTFARSQSHKRILQDPKMLYLGLGLVSIGLRIWLTVVCFLQTGSDAGILQRLWVTATSLFPATFFRHSAQSSISSDHVCVALSAAVFVLLESGLWLFNAALASPSALDTVTGRVYTGKLSSEPGKPLTVLLGILKLGDTDRKLIETQARIIVALLVLSPLLGGSATLSLYLAVRYTWAEQYRQHQLVEDFACSLADNGGRDYDSTNVLEEREETELVENEEGERYVEICEIKVKQLLPGGTRRRRAEPRIPTPPWSPDEDGESRASSRSGGSSVKQEGTQTEERGSQRATARRRRGSQSRSGDDDAPAASSVEGSGRRTTPMRHRQPPQRYRADST